MKCLKYILVYLLIITSSKVLFSQKYFEGKMTQEVTYSNNANGNSTIISYYKNNKNRTDYDKLTGDNPFTSISIVDFDKRERVMLMDMPKLKMKTATLSDVTLTERPIEKLEKFDDYKMILNHKCQKIILTSISNGKETKLTGYADLNYLLKTLLDFSGKTIDYPLFFEAEIVMPSMTMTMNIINFSEEILSENLFNDNIPANYQLTDIRKNKGQSITSNYNSPTNTNTGKQIEDFSQFTNAELDEKLQAALKIEDYDKAEKLKEVIEKRGGTLFKYKSKTIAELQEMLKKAVTTEDFDTATQIQEEIKKRG